MADTLVEGNVNGFAEQAGGLWGPYYISPLVGVLVLVDSLSDVNAYRTTDGGANWSLIEVTTNITEKVAVYYDRENPGDTGTLLHIWWLEEANGVLKYKALDIADGSFGTERTIATLESGASSIAFSRLAACKTLNGNLLCTGRSHDGTAGATFAYRSTDGGANWDSRTTGWEDINDDSGELYAANTGDGADAALIYYDDSAAALSVKMYDDSANTWTETGILTSFDAGSITVVAGAYQFDAAILHSDGRIFGAGFTDPNVAGNDLVTFVITPDSIASPTIDTTTANILTDVTEAGYCAVTINQQNNDIYVAYGNGSAIGSAIGVDYVVSDDLMESWGSPVTYAEGTDDDIKAISGPRSIGDGGGLVQWSFFNQDLNDVYVNLVNDVMVAARSAAINGTAPGSSEEDIVSGGQTIIITLTNATLVADDGTFAAARQAIIDGLDSAQSEATGWNNEVRDKQGVSGVVRTSDTVVTITLDAQAAYDITANETITVTVPATAVVSAAPITATPTFDITVAASGSNNFATLGVGA